MFPLRRHFIICFFAISSLALAYNIECEYKTKTDWYAIDNVYFCNIATNLSKCAHVIDVDTTVTSVSGTHLDGKTNADVVGFRADGKTVNYFPHGLEKFFTPDKIVFINIWSSGLKEIHGEDLAPYTNVKFISFSDNDLEVIEPDLFKYNPKLEIIGFPKNKIKKVDTTVFDQLNGLVSLYMNKNACISKEVTRNRKKVLQLINEMKKKC